MKVAAAVCTDSDPRAARPPPARGGLRPGRRARGSGARVRRRRPPDVAGPDPGGDRAELSPGATIGCGAGGVLGAGHEYESGTAVAVWAARWARTASPSRSTRWSPSVTASGVLEGMPELTPDSGLILLTDPYTFPTGPVFDRIAQDSPWVPVLGGLASGRSTTGHGALLLDDGICDQGAVGLHLRNVEMLPCVSQGAAPLGREMTVTAAEGNVIHELAGKPAVATIEAVICELSLADRALIACGLLIGIVIDSGKPEYEQGDFLVRGVLGADSATGSIQVGATVSVGQVIRLHARDAASAGSDLRRELTVCATATGQSPRPARSCSPATAAGARCSATATTTRRWSTSCSAAPQRWLLRRGRDRPGRWAQLPARVHRDRRGVPRVSPPAGRAALAPRPRCRSSALGHGCSLRARPRSSPAQPAGWAGDRVRPASPRRRADRQRSTRGRAGVAGGGARSADRGGRPDRPRRRRAPRRARARGGVDVLVANAALPASGLLSDLTERRSIGCSTSTCARRSCSPTRWRRRWSPAAAGTWCSSPRCRARRRRRASSLYSATKFGLRGFALALRQDLAPHGVGVSLVSPGFIRDAGMFADSGVKLPPGAGTKTPATSPRR